MPLLSDQIKLKRRYSRSINLERDLELVDSVFGYIPTTRAIDCLERFLKSLSYANTNRAWTITGLYGTGKSAFAHFLASLCATSEHEMKINAFQILEEGSPTEKLIGEQLKSKLPEEGLVRAIATATYEPVSNTIIKALFRGVYLFYKEKKQKPDIFRKLEDLMGEIAKGEKISNQKVLDLLKDVAETSHTGVLLIIDELGKNLEFATHNQTSGDLFLLQQIAELPADNKNPKIFIIGLLHRAFSDYSHNLTIIQRNEWAKIQGRFEDIPFNESTEQIIKLIGNAIDKGNNNLEPLVSDWSQAWKGNLLKVNLNGITHNDIKNIYPLHPLSAFVLPLLCSRYAQNDRTLFTFLTGEESHSLANFLRESTIDNKKLPALKLHRLYDYFVESAGITTSSLPQYQRWVEIQGYIHDANHHEPEIQKILKTIGVLNLVTSSTGSLKASRRLVALALCDKASDESLINYWDNKIQGLLDKGLLTWRKQIDELRIWEGSDFEIEKAILQQVEEIKEPLGILLAKFNSIRPVVIQRHSYTTGTLRYFERQFVDSSQTLADITCQNNSDGLICYWTDKKELLSQVPETTKDGKPLVIICPSELGALSSACLEYAALKTIEKNYPQLRTDGIARREVRFRLDIARKILDESFLKAFNVRSGVSCWISGKEEILRNEMEFKSRLSDLCDDTYINGLTLWNELINRRQLSSQASNARRILITAMIDNSDKDKFGITGYGPERSIYESLLGKTEIHKPNGDGWKIDRPSEESGILPVWEAIEEFCKQAVDAPAPVDHLYKKLKESPYGVKDGPIPILLAAVLLKYSDEFTLYQAGTFIPVLGSEHFELLMKNPERFAVKHIPITGLRLKVFKALESIIYKSGNRTLSAGRNETILGIVKPLVKFAMNLPAYTRNTKKNLSPEAIALRNALLSSKEPDNLIFVEIPKALGFPAIDENLEEEKIKSFKDKLAKTIQELNTAYEKLISECRQYICNAFSIESSELKQRLPMRARFLSGLCVERHLTRLVFASMDDNQDEKGWLEGLVMVISDKPASSWSDEDLLVFENNLANLSRKFINLEALQKNYSPGEGFDVRRITLTRPDGTEVNQMVWIEEKYKKDADDIIEEILKKTGGNKQLHQTLIAGLTEKILKD